MSLILESQAGLAGTSLVHYVSARERKMQHLERKIRNIILLSVDSKDPQHPQLPCCTPVHYALLLRSRAYVSEDQSLRRAFAGVELSAPDF